MSTRAWHSSTFVCQSFPGLSWVARGVLSPASGLLGSRRSRLCSLGTIGACWGHAGCHDRGEANLGLSGSRGWVELARGYPFADDGCVAVPVVSQDGGGLELSSSRLKCLGSSIWPVGVPKNGVGLGV